MPIVEASASISHAHTHVRESVVENGAWDLMSIEVAILEGLGACAVHELLSVREQTRHRLHIDRELTDMREDIQRLRAELDAAREPDQQ